jgi:hypothetical protein
MEIAKEKKVVAKMVTKKNTKAAANSSLASVGLDE